jgi:hypothetical protein
MLARFRDGADDGGAFHALQMLQFFVQCDEAGACHRDLFHEPFHINDKATARVRTMTLGYLPMHQTPKAHQMQGGMARMGVMASGRAKRARQKVSLMPQYENMMLRHG